MKRLITSIAIALLPGIAAADWDIEKDFALLKNQASTPEALVLMSTKDGNFTSILVSGEGICEPMLIKSGEKKPIPSLNWNGVKVKMEAVCMLDKALLLRPETKEGQEYVITQIFNNNDISVKFPTGVIIKYKNPNGSKAVKSVFDKREGI